MQRAFERASDGAEWFVSRWWGFAIITALCAWWVVRGQWEPVDRFTFLFGFALLLLLTGAGRRDSKATHGKLDTLTPGHDLDRLEERAECEIERLRS